MRQKKRQQQRMIEEHKMAMLHVLPQVKHPPEETSTISVVVSRNAVVEAEAPGQ